MMFILFKLNEERFKYDVVKYILGDRKMVMRLSFSKKVHTHSPDYITFDKLPDEYIKNEFPEEWKEREKERIRSLYYYLPILFN